MITSPAEIAVKENNAKKHINRLREYVSNEKRLLNSQEQDEFDKHIKTLEECKKEKSELAKKVKADISKKDEQVKSIS